MTLRITPPDHFISGMYVRAPQDITRDDGEFREFRIGQIRSIDSIAATALVYFLHPDCDEAVEEEYPLSNLNRCRILPDTLFTSRDESKTGRILIHCSDDYEPGRLLDYYVLFHGEKNTQRVSEADISVSSVRQNTQPEVQLQRYEFQNPQWRNLRDQVIESYGILRNATYGIEDLVGSRIMLLAHQAEVVARVLGDPNCRYILADEVGLGKTIEACVILRGLQRRNPLLKTLIIAPSSLTQQWKNELNSKFWLSFPLLQNASTHILDKQARGYIISIEDLTQNQSLWHLVNQVSWGLLIVDEAHHIRKSEQAYERVHHLSKISQGVLILSATPIQRRAVEYLKLLALMNPHKYDPEDIETFKVMLKAQGKIRRKVALLSQSLGSEDFDPDEFDEEIHVLVRELKYDEVLRTIVNNFSHSKSQSVEEAIGILAYISENYRIENRVIRNRRAHLTISLPHR